MIPKTTILCILDGWGHRADAADNAILQADTPTYDRLWQTAPRAWLATSGLAVGLPDGQMGNSEIGHMNLGSGRVVMADLPRIDDAIASGTVDHHENLIAFADRLKAVGGAAHIMGLLSPGGVHSHQNHMVALARILTAQGVPVVLHGFLDGRDTPPCSAKGFLTDFEAALKAEAPGAKLVTLTGRFYAMDRDKRWDRVEQAYRIMAEASGRRAATAQQALQEAYAAGEEDEFVKATALGDYQGMGPSDGILMANFRADRAREILHALIDPDFTDFDRPKGVISTHLAMVDYSDDLAALMPSLFPAEDIQNSFGAVISAAGQKQLRIAETEKYAHVTFFFSGGREDCFDGEDRILVPSPDVETYDLKPEMSAPEVTDKLVSAIKSGAYSTIIVNYANPDMVGHTGKLDAAIKAVETIDACLARLEAAVKETGSALLLTADHGNVELMRDQETGVPHTAHTHFDVPLLLMNYEAALTDGRLADVAPTLLDMMGLEQPPEMSGTSLVTRGAMRAHG